jgi:hypothetical protein
MYTLSDIQNGIRRALVEGDRTQIAPLLVGGANPEHRLAIHQRHYAASLTRALVERFPATVWLVGSAFLTQAARSYVRDCPPASPCIAEYGEGFPIYLGTQSGAERLPYLTSFAELEWHVGRLALATDRSPNVQHLHLEWSVDELMAVYLSDSAPDQFALRHEDVWLEVRGLRGELQLRRLTVWEFARAIGDRSTGAQR